MEKELLVREEHVATGRIHVQEQYYLEVHETKKYKYGQESGQAEKQDPATRAGSVVFDCRSTVVAQNFEQ
jgi:hypothetical protein